MTQGAVHIRLSDVSVYFDGVTALKNVSLDIPKGESLALIGPSAAGKSVLLKTLVGLHRPRRGTVLIGGRDLYRLGRGALADSLDRIGMLFQQNALFDSLTIWENVAFRLLRGGRMARAEARARAVDLLARVGLTADTADLSPADLSGGMQKRVGVARAIATDPDILLLDNPTAGLDPVLTSHIHEMIAGIVRDRGATAITVTNEMTAARTRHHRLAMLHDGQVKWHGATRDIEAVENAYLTQMLNGAAHGPIAMRARRRSA